MSTLILNPGTSPNTQVLHLGTLRIVFIDGQPVSFSPSEGEWIVAEEEQPAEFEEVLNHALASATVMQWIKVGS